MIIYIYGEDTLRSRQYLKEQVDKFKTARDPQGYNVVFVAGYKNENSKIMSEIMAVPFLAEKRMVIVENILSNNDKELLGELIERVTSVIPAKVGIQTTESQIKSGMAGKKTFPESNIIVFYQSEPLARIKEVKELETLLKKEKYAKDFPLLKGAQLQSWVVSEIKNRGGKISASAASYLSTNATDMWYLNTLIDQLVAYSHHPTTPPQAGGDKKEIQMADVQLFLDEKIDDNIFNMAEAIAVGNKKNAFKLLNHQRDLGEDEMHLFLMILRQFRILTQMRALFEENEKIGSDEIARELDLHPFVVKKSLTLMKRFSLTKLTQIYDKLLQIDVKTKTGTAPQSLLLDLFVGEI